jgi:hypothetical protein
MSKFVDITTLEQFSIVEFLARLGHHPVKRSGKEHIYHSMLRETLKRTPSFTVYDAGGKWKDWGGPNESGIAAGSIIQLGMAYWPTLSYPEVLHHISRVCQLNTGLDTRYVAPRHLPAQTQVSDPRFQLIKTDTIGSNFVLTQYLQSRGVLDVARDHLKELYYRYSDSPDSNQRFYAVGWRNERNGWEFANAKGFKSSIGPKAISFIPGASGKVALFESCMDYLSWLKLQPQHHGPSVLILNSVSMLTTAIDKISTFPEVDIYFDLDNAGRKCTSDLQHLIPYATDGSVAYQGFKDYNEKLMALLHHPVGTDQDHNPDLSPDQGGYHR